MKCNNSGSGDLEAGMHGTSQLGTFLFHAHFIPTLSFMLTLFSFQQEVWSVGCDFLEQCDKGSRYTISAKKSIRSDCHRRGIMGVVGGLEGGGAGVVAFILGAGYSWLLRYIL